MAKDRFKKCQCNTIPREDGDFMMTTHHPHCKLFDPGSEIKSLEMQCKHFFSIIQNLKEKIRELNREAEDIELCDSY